MTCVSPRVKSAEPWVHGRAEASALMGRTSSLPRPSERRPSLRSMPRMASVHSVLIAPCTCAESYLLSPSSPSNAASSSAPAAARALPRSFFSEMRIALSYASPAAARATSKRSSGGSSRSPSCFGLPTRAAHSSMAAAVSAMAACPISTASSSVSSGRKSAKPSIISTARFVPAITRSRVDSFIWDVVGLSTSWPSMRPTRAPATAAVTGTLDSASAADDAVIASGSARFSPSYDMRLVKT
mmetsp:Transcript_7731/g.31425  ORF Transcript_7731/g.31425 Transcript_7731/m.31425 type:complete len:242 (-) Transcript_7731:409-1134(-)